jgi:DNA-binding MarR family transcriptional regulator
MNLEEVRNYWAKVLGIRGPQWMIIVALQELDHGEGAPVMAVATMLHVNPTFVMTQSRLLERKGFVRRTAVSDDSGTVSLSLTDKAYRALGETSLSLVSAGAIAHEASAKGKFTNPKSRVSMTAATRMALERYVNRRIAAYNSRVADPAVRIIAELEARALRSILPSSSVPQTPTYRLRPLRGEFAGGSG